MIELKTYAGSNVTPQNDAIMNDTNTLKNGIYYGCNVTIKDATTLHINAGQGIVYGRLFEVLDSDIPVSLSPSGTLLGQLYVHIDLSNIAAPIQILVDTGETLAVLKDDPQLNIDSGITDMQLATFTVSTVGMSDLVETFKAVEPIRAVLGDADISAIGDGSVKGAIRTINTRLSDLEPKALATVTANGSKTNTQLLNELFALLDVSKVTAGSKLVIDNSGAINVYHIIAWTPSYTIFVQPTTSSGGARTTAYNVSATSSAYQSTGTTEVDFSSSVVTSGTVFTIYNK